RRAHHVHRHDEPLGLPQDRFLLHPHRHHGWVQLPRDLMRKAADVMNMKQIVSVYGQTEASPGCTMSSFDDPLDVRTDTVGSAFANVECKIVDPDTGEECPVGVSGE